MVDMIFSYGELGFQEVETAKYLTGILEKEGFKIERNVAGIPTAWVATWGSGKPVIALGSDVDCIPQASQKPGVAYHDPLVEGAPGHGEGHNSAEYHCCDCGETTNAARETSRHDQSVARRCGRACGGQSIFRSRRCFQGCRRRAVYARRKQSQHVVGTIIGDGTRVG
jgi:hypothetical protein